MEVCFMEDNQQKLEQNQREKPMSFIAMVFWTGLIGGILWSSLAYLAHIFSFTEIHPNVILEPWAIGDWKKGWLGTVISILLIGMISVGAAFIYYVALRKFKSIWVGAAYGIILFLLVFFVLNPIFPGISPLGELKRDTIITSVCFYILFGVFVGYSISYEENELHNQGDQEARSS
jgi:Zn-dependent protease with chaperone function